MAEIGRQKTKENIITRGKFRIVENALTNNEQTVLLPVLEAELRDSSSILIDQ